MEPCPACDGRVRSLFEAARAHREALASGSVGKTVDAADALARELDKFEPIYESHQLDPGHATR